LDIKSQYSAVAEYKERKTLLIKNLIWVTLRIKLPNKSNNGTAAAEMYGILLAGKNQPKYFTILVFRHVSDIMSARAVNVKEHQYFAET
jgi:hypothetical protein